MKILKILFMSTVIAGLLTAAQSLYAANMSSITLINHTKVPSTVGAPPRAITDYTLNWRVFNSGDHHICKVKITNDNWSNYKELQAKFIRHLNGTEEWQLIGRLDGHGTIKYVFSCTDMDISVSETLSNGTTRNSFGLTLNSAVMVL